MMVAICMFILMLQISIIRTVITNPGSIPEDKEWDMNSDNQTESDSEDEQDIAIIGQYNSEQLISKEYFILPL